MRAKSSIGKLGIEADVPVWELAFAVFLALTARGPFITSTNDPAISRTGTIREIRSFTTTSLTQKIARFSSLDVTSLLHRPANVHSALAPCLPAYVAGRNSHFAIGYRVLAGFDGFMAKWIAGWIGGWLGSAVYGHWGYNIQYVYIIILALLGSFSLAFLATASLKASAMANATATPERTAAPLELRKAS